MYVCLASVTDRNYKLLDSEGDFGKALTSQSNLSIIFFVLSYAVVIT